MHARLERDVERGAARARPPRRSPRCSRVRQAERLVPSSPTTRPLRTSTAPTTGLGLVRPRPRSASLMARRMEPTSSSVERADMESWSLWSLGDFAENEIAPSGFTGEHAKRRGILRGTPSRSFFHPDCHGRPRSSTGSAVGAYRIERRTSSASAASARGLYRRWGLAPRPEGFASRGG